MIKIIIGNKQSSLQEDSSQVHYAIWGTNQQVDEGFEVPNWKPKALIVELFLEDVRRRVNPKAPSRFNCKFVFPEIEGNLKDPRQYGLPYQYYYHVIVNGNTFKTDLDVYTQILERIEDHFRDRRINIRQLSLDEAKTLYQQALKEKNNIFRRQLELAKAYWDENRFPSEILVDGKVVVVQAMDQEDMGDNK